MSAYLRVLGMRALHLWLVSTHHCTAVDKNVLLGAVYAMGEANPSGPTHVIISSGLLSVYVAAFPSLFPSDL